MKKFLIVLVVLLLLGGLIFGLLYFFWTPENIALLGQKAMQEGKSDRAVRYYEMAWEKEPENPDYAISLADACIAAGSYTQAERCLVKSIQKAPSAELYGKLSQVYVAQDKLLDAQEMLDGIQDPELFAQLSAQRPQAPTFSYAGGEYDEYISVELSAPAGTVCYSVSAEYPSLNSVYAEPITLSSGESRITAIAVGENGLVSTLAAQDYLIYGVVEELSFADETLEAYVRDTLYIARTAAITTEDLWSFTELTLDEPLTDYSDLRYFVNLTALSLKGCTAEDYSFLDAMPELRSLNLSGAEMPAEAVEHIGGLALLESLDLTGCKLSNISALAGNTALTSLLLSQNSVSDLTPLSGMTKLTELTLDHNAVTSLKGLESLKNLVTLDISENNISDLSPLSGCVKLETLSAGGNAVSNLAPLSGMTKLTTLSLSDNRISDLSDLATCTSLTRLEVAQNELTDVNVIASLDNLTHLDASYNAITALPALKSTAMLGQVNLSYNQLEDISALAGLLSLYYVNVDYNAALTDIECLVDCYILARVDAFGTQVTEVAKLLDLGVSVNYDPSVAINQDD